MKQGDAIVISHNAASMSDRNDDSYSLLKAEKNKDPSRSRKKQKKQKKKKKQERKVAKVGSNSFHSPDTDSSSSASLGSSSEDFGSESDFSGDESLASTGSEFASSSGDDSGSESNLGKKRKKKEGKAKSEATQRALLRRRRHKKNAAIKIQAFARGCLCRQEVGLMVAELISQLQVQVGSSTSAIDSTVDESKPKMTAAGSTSGGASVTSDSSMNEFVLNAYLNCTFGEDSDDNVHLDQSNNNNDEIIDGLCFPSTLPSNFDDEDTKSKSTSSLNENQDSDENISFKEKISMFGQATSRPTWFGLAKEVVKSSTVKEQKHSEDNISSKGGLDFKGKLSTFGQKSNIQPSWTGRAQQTQSSTINSENKKIDDHDSNDNISFKEKLNMFGQKTDSQLSSTGLSKHPSNSTLSSEGKGSDDQASNGSISFKDKIDMFGQKSSAKIGPKSHSGTPPLPTSRKFSPKRPAGTLSIPTSKKVPTQVEIQAESSEGSLSMDDEIIPIPSNHTEPAMETPLPPIPNATSANTSLSPGELKIVARIKELGSKKDAAENDKMVGIPRGKPPPEFVEQRSVQAVRSSFELGNKDTNAPMTQDFETLNAPKQRASASIVQKIKQLGVDIPPVAPSSFEKISEEVEESKMIDFAAHQYLLHESAARIQALARGFLYRKKDLESTMVVLRWLQEQRPGEDLSAESVTEDREFDGKEAMNVIREDSETDGNDEETEHAIERVERSSDDEDDTQELEEMGGSSNDEFEEPLSFAERQLAFQQKAGNDLSDNMGLVGSVEEASAQRAARRRRLNGSATKIQAVVRGHLARSIDYHAMVYAVKWLQGHRRVDDLEKNEGGGYRASLVDAVSAAAGAKALASAQRRIQNAAIQMQSLARGYLCRKFDMEALTSTLLWLREYKRLHALSTEIEVVEPKEEHLETIWTFLQDNSERTAGSESDKTNTSNTGLLHEPGHAEGKENNEASKRTYDVP